MPAEEDIPIAYYGTSNIGQLKYVYRKGLALRYGKTMQCIAGIHYNFSLPEQLWPLLKETEGFVGTDRDYQSTALATSWDVSEDGLTWTFHLRDGVKFHTTKWFAP